MLIDGSLINSVSDEARHSLRLRKNFNFHQSLEDKCQRMLNVMLVGTKFDIHRHLNTAETFVLLKGCLDIIFYDDQGIEVQRHRLNPLDGSYGIHIPAGQWHSLEILEDSTIFETREGPYIPVSIDNGLIFNKLSQMNKV